MSTFRALCCHVCLLLAGLAFLAFPALCWGWSTGLTTNKWVSDWVSEAESEWVSEWGNEAGSKWVSEWVRKWVSEGVSEGPHGYLQLGGGYMRYWASPSTSYNPWWCYQYKQVGMSLSFTGGFTPSRHVRPSSEPIYSRARTYSVRWWFPNEWN